MSECTIACTLSGPDFAQRREAVLELMRARLRELRRLPNGYALRFDPTGDQLTTLAELIDVERRCCPFLRFQLTVEPDGGAIWLELSGPSSTADWLADELGLASFAPGPQVCGQTSPTRGAAA
jgi:hypothetical protein